MKEFVKGPRYFATTLLLGILTSAAGAAQTGAPPAQDAAEPQQPASTQAQPAPPKGQVLFQSHGEAPTPATAPEPAVDAVPAATVTNPTGTALSDQERSAILVTAYDLDARIDPATSHLGMRAQMTLRNEGAVPLTRIALQVSSTLRWESAALVSAPGEKPLELSQHLLDTDADHTGKANEAVIGLPEPLAPGQSLRLDTFYSGTIDASGGRLERIGASHAQAVATDWDAIAPEATALRGFGDVLWYPVASPQLFLGDGAQLFEAIGATKLRESTATVHLRLSVEYKGDAPIAAYFCGRRQALVAISDDNNAPIASGSGIATAEFAAEPLGFRVPSLFLVAQPESLIAPLPADYNKASAGMEQAAQPAPDAAGNAAGNEAGRSSGTSSSSSSSVPSTSDGGPGAPMLAVETADEGSLPALAASAEQVAPLLEEWLGPQPLSALTVLDQPGQPFEDGPLLVGPVAALAAPSAGHALVHSMTHAWVQTGRPWMDEGLAEFFALLWTEREQGREVAIAQLDDMVQPLAIAEPAIEPPPAGAQAAAQSVLKPASEGQVVGQPLIAAASELYYRRKAAAVWWMLRSIVGDEALEEALRAWRMREPGTATAEQDALAFERLLERSGRKNARNPIDLRWFFNDWVLHDRGLPDLSIIDVTPRELPAGPGHSVGWLVAVTVRNDGAASAEVPVTIRSDTFSETSQLRIAGFASATARVIVEAPPAEVLVNDGGTPEVRTSFHKVTVAKSQQQP